MKTQSGYKSVGLGGGFRRWAISLLVGCFSLACGEAEELHDGPWINDGVETEQSVSELRGRPSKLCDCPPRTRVFYSNFEPDCAWVCRKLAEPKRCGPMDSDADGRTRTVAHERGSDREIEDHAACSPDDIDGQRSRDDQGPERRALSGLCVSVCPDGTIVGPHRCSFIPECMKSKSEYIDVSAEGSSTLDTRSVNESDEDRKRVHNRSAHTE